MKNILNYYYSLYPDEVSYNNNRYFFEYNFCSYVLELFNRPISDIEALYNLNKDMIDNNLLVHKIIKNNENKIITYINGSAYILLEISVNKKALANLPEICFINNNSTNIKEYNLLKRTNWTELWEMKIDYFESQINEIGNKYPNLCNYANYYIGLGENAISYVKEAVKLDDIALISVCHKRLNSTDTYYELYHPINFIEDYRIRDVSEYIKSCFFNEDNAYSKIIEYFSNNYISYKEALLFYGRLLYPSYFFDLYDDIVNEDLNENKIEDIILKADDYETFLYDVYCFLSKLYNRYIPPIDWIIKKSFKKLH